MPKKLSDNLYYLSWILIFILFLVAVRLVKLYDIFCSLLKIVAPILFGYIFAWILFPLYKKINKKIDRRLSFALLIVFFIGLYALIIWKFLPILVDNFSNIVDLLKTYIDKFSEYPFLENLKGYSKVDVDVIINSCSNLISFIIEFALIHIFGFYILYSYDNVNAFLRSLIPSKFKKITLEYIRKLSSNMRFYIKGTIIDTLILFGISIVLYWAIGLEYPVIIALFSAITNIIPFVGPYIGGIPAVIIGLSTSLNLGLVTVGVIVFAQTLESNIINPMIMSKCIKVNPLLIMISLTIMGSFFGVFGMIFAVPIIIIFKITLEFVKKYKKVEMETSS